MKRLATPMSLLLCAHAWAAPPAPPLQGVDFVAERAFVGDPLRGLLPGDDGVIFAVNADDPAGMASTTKSFTLLLAVEAIEDGMVDLDDLVTISPKAATVAHGAHSNAGFETGEQVRFEDLLYAVMMPSAADASVAVAQHIAVAYDPPLAAESDAAQEAAFVQRMNDRAAELDLTETTFFNPYGGDHAHDDDNTPGDLVEHVASTRDMVRWFHYGMQKPLFETIAGFQGTYAFFTIKGEELDFYQYSAGAGYPGVIGQKGGSNETCLICGLTETRRLGRVLAIATTQAQVGDGTLLLDYAFAALFHPQARGESAQWTGGWVDHDLTCVDDEIAASVAVRPNGELRILLWGHDVDASTIEHLNPIVTPEGPGGLTRGSGGGDGRRPGGLVSPTRNAAPGGLATPSAGRDPLPPGPDDVTDGSDRPIATAARITYADNGHLAVIAETDDGITLQVHGITPQRTVFRRDSAFVGEGTDARVLWLGGNLLVTAHRLALGHVRLTSWHLDPSTGNLSNPLATWDGPFTMAGELAISGRPGRRLRNRHVLLATRDFTDGLRRITSVRVRPLSGLLSERDDFVGGGASQLALTRVDTFGSALNSYALAFRDDNGLLNVAAIEMSATGALSEPGVTTGLTVLDEDATLAIADYDAGGVMVVAQATPGTQRLETWALDVNGSAVVPAQITVEPVVQSGVLGMCRVPDDAAEGDFLLARGADLEGIRVQAWRSAPR